MTEFTLADGGKGDLPCSLCHSPAVKIFYFNKGCFCRDDKVQALCEHHVQKAMPTGTMEFICLVPGVRWMEGEL